MIFIICSLHLNQYFLLLACLQLWKDITPINPIATWTPLVFIVGVGMLKELIDDLFRWKRDREANNTRCCVIENGIKVNVR